LEQDVADAWAWLQQNYPDLTNDVSSVNPAALLDHTGASGIINPFTNSIYIRKSYYTQCLSDSQKDELRQTLAHEALHIYLNSKIGTLDYLKYDYRVGYHDWIHNTAANIASYEGGIQAPLCPPSIPTQTYPLTPMTDSLTRNLKSRWKPIAWIAGVPALGFVCVMLYLVYQERDQAYWSRLYLAKSEIAAIETAAESFHKDRGSYPTDLQELVHKAGDSGSDRQYLVRIPNNPWGGSFRYEVEHGASGESIKIWAVPDRKTQDKIGITELSNRTNWQAILKP
jgi:Type II secretion system (T2SS), protein G